MTRVHVIQALMVGLLGAISFFTLSANAAAIPVNEDSTLEARGLSKTSSWFNLQSFVVDRKYHKTTPTFISFAGGDASVTNSSTDAAKFWTWKGHLGVANKFVHLDFSNGYAVVKLEKRPSNGAWKFLHGQDQWLHIQGPGFSYGEGGQAVFCHSDDGGIFLQGQNKPPFACRDIGLSPRQGAGPKPRSAPPRHGRPGSPVQSSAIPTVTANNAPPSAPSWWAHPTAPTPTATSDASNNQGASSPPPSTGSGSDTSNNNQGGQGNQGNSNNHPNGPGGNGGDSNHHPNGPGGNGNSNNAPSGSGSGDNSNNNPSGSGDWNSNSNSGGWGDEVGGHQGHQPTQTTPSSPTITAPPQTTASGWATETPSSTRPYAPDPSSDEDWTEWKRDASEFDAEGEAIN